MNAKYIARNGAIALAVYPASPQAAAITGQAYNVDGGALMV